MEKTPRYWVEARKRYLSENNRLVEFQRRNAQLMSDIRDYDERQEALDTEFGIEYGLLKPYIDEYHAEQKAKKRRGPGKQSKPEQASESKVELESDASVGVVAEAVANAGDLEDVRWAIANLSRTGVGPKDAPSQIAWNLLLIARSGVQGQLKLLDIYRATIIQPTAKAREAELGRTDADDAHLSDLMSRLGDGLADSEDPQEQSGVEAEGVSSGSEIQA